MLLYLATLLLLGIFHPQINSSVDASRVLELTDRFLDVRQDGRWLVMFYAPWCGYCKRTEPIWAHVAQALASTPIRVGRVDCTRFTAVGKHFGINSYPTIMFIKGNQQHVFTGDRTTEDLLPYARRMSGPPVQQITRPESVQTLRSAHDLFFLYVGAESGALWDAYSSVAVNFQAHGFFYAATADTQVAKQVGTDRNPVVTVCKGKISCYVFNGDHDGSKQIDTDQLNVTLTQWINEERFTHFPKITRANINQAMQTKKFLALAVVEENKINELASHEHDFRELMENFTIQYYERYHRRFQFGWIGSPELAHSIIMDFLPTPHLLVLNATTAEHHLAEIDATNLKMEDVKDFLDDIHEQRAKTYGGNGLMIRIYRIYFESWTSLTNMWRGNPVLTTVMFGLPMGFLSLIIYSMFCADIMDAPFDDDAEDDDHEKRE